MKVVRAMMVVCVALVFAGTVKADAKEDIVGKWEMKQKVGEQEFTGQIEFTKDGKMEMSFMGLKIAGTYAVKSDTELEMTIDIMGQKKTEMTKIKVGKDTLEITNKGKTDTLKRIK